MVPEHSKIVEMTRESGEDPGGWLEAAGYGEEEGEAPEPPVPLPLEAESGYVPRPSDSALPVLGTLRGGVMCMPRISAEGKRFLQSRL